MKKVLLMSVAMVLVCRLIALGASDNSQLSTYQLSTNSSEGISVTPSSQQIDEKAVTAREPRVAARPLDLVPAHEKAAADILGPAKQAEQQLPGRSASPYVNSSVAAQSNSDHDLPHIQTTYFTEGFENGGTIPLGWADVPGGTYPWLFNDGSGPGMPGSTHGGNYLAYFNVYSFPAGTQDSLISPVIFLNGNGNYQLVFWSWDELDPRGIMDSVYVKIKFGNGRFNYLTTVPYDSFGWIQNIVPFYTLASTIQIEFVGHSGYGYTCPSIDDIAVMDVASEGRCCYGDPQSPSCDVNTQLACDSLGGSWAMGEDCITSPCIAAPSNDECSAAQAITGPYPQTIYGSTVAATVDCPDLFNWNGVWYTIDLPYGLNDVSIDFIPTCALGGMDWIGIVYTADCSCTDAMLFESEWEFCLDGSYYSKLSGIIPGPTTIYFPCWAADASRNGIDFGFTIDVGELILPPNDNCVNAQPIGYVANEPFCTIAASFDGSGACQDAPNVWYRFTAPETGPVNISLCGSQYDTRLAVYAGPDCPAGNPEPIPLQGGDTFANAVDIGVPDAAYSGTTTDLFHDVYLSCDGTNIAPDAVYSYTPASDGVINVALCGSSFDTILGIFMDNDSTEIGCNDDFCGVQSEIDSIAVTAGHTYYFVISGYSGSFGDYVISITSPIQTLLDCNDDFCGLQSQVQIQAQQGQQYLIEAGGFGVDGTGYGVLTTAPPPPPPPNDSCINADNGGLLTPGVPMQFTGTTAGATPDCDLGAPEVWITFTINECQNVAIDECGTSPIFNNVFVVIEQSCCGGDIYADGWDDTSCDGNFTVYFSNLPPGQYWYPVMAEPGAGRSYVLNVNGETCPPPPPNDSCGSVTPLALVPGTPLTFAGDNTGATSDCPLLGTPDVWHAFTIDQNLKVTVDFCGSDPVHTEFFLIMAKDCPCSDYVLRDFMDFTSCSDSMVTLVFNLLLPGTYYIPILSIPNQWGPYTIHVNGVAPPPPPENACQGSTLIYTNGPDDGGINLASQCDPSSSLTAEVADDFVLPGSGVIEIGEVVSFCGFWNGAGQSPDLLTGIKLVIYADNGGVPAGQPMENDPGCAHLENVPGGIVASFEYAPGEFRFGQMTSGAWQIEMPLNPPAILSAGTTYWLGFQPVMDSSTGGQCGTFTTSGVTGSHAVQGFPSLGTPFWTPTNYDVAFCLLGGGCDYVVGDINGNGTTNGIDVGYGVNYFKGGPTPPVDCGIICPQPSPFYAGGDVNGNCVFNGIDITFFVNYLKGVQPALLNCPTCPPAGLPGTVAPAVIPINTPVLKSNKENRQGD